MVVAPYVGMSKKTKWRLHTMYRPFAMGGARTYVLMVNVVVAILSVKRAPKLLTVID